MAQFNTVNKNNHLRARAYLSTQTSATLTTSGTYYQLTTNITDGVTGTMNGFTLASGTLTNTSGRQAILHFTGSADGSVDKLCRITFTLFINDVAWSGCSTPVDFNNVGKNKGFSCNSNVVVEAGQTIKVKAKSDTASTTLTLDSFNISFWGI